MENMGTAINDNWYEDFFQGLNCELWEKVVSDDWTNREVNFLESELCLKQGAHLLDIPCGFGRHAVEFSKKGYKVTGIDISQKFVSDLTKKIKFDKLNMEVIQGDILKVNLSQKYSAAICMGNSFGYFSFDKMKLFVEKVSLSLETGARFIINSGMIAESILPNFSSHESFIVDDIKMDITLMYNIDEGCTVSNILYTKGDKTEKHAFKHYVFTIAEVTRLLENNGLKVIAAYGSLSKTDFKLGDQQVYIVAEKKD